MPQLRPGELLELQRKAFAPGGAGSDVGLSQTLENYYREVKFGAFPAETQDLLMAGMLAQFPGIFGVSDTQTFDYIETLMNNVNLMNNIIGGLQGLVNSFPQTGDVLRYVSGTSGTTVVDYAGLADDITSINARYSKILNVADPADLAAKGAVASDLGSLIKSHFTAFRYDSAGTGTVDWADNANTYILASNEA